MGTLLHISSRRSSELLGRVVVGRSRRSDLRIPNRRVSAEHAILTWTGVEWQVRDLGSTNGTFLDGHRLAVGSHSRVRRNALVAFGDPEDAWQLVSDSPPLPQVCHVGSDTLLDQDGPIIGLPSVDDPVATIYWTAGGWRLEQDGSSVEILGTSRHTVAGEEYEVRFPPQLAGTLGGGTPTRDPGEPLSGFRFIFSRRPQVGVGMDAEGRSGRLHLQPRAHHATLLVLAKRRLADVVAGVAVDDAGWVEFDELTATLTVEPKTLNVHIYRARQELARHGICGAGGIVERRATTKQLRFGGRTVTVLDV